MTGPGLTVYGCTPDEAEVFDRLAARAGVATTLASASAPAATARSDAPDRCISVGHTAPLDGAALRALKERGVEFICTRSIGIDHIDLDAAGELGLVVENVMYAPDGVADHTLMLVLMAIRGAKAVVRAAEVRDFRLGAVRGRELRDLTVGVVGVGRIGSAVIDRLQGFGCRVLAHGRSGSERAGAESRSLDELLQASDVVTLHLPLTSETHHLLGSERIDSMKPGAVLVNTARGALVDTDALIAALERGHLGGVALDVLEGEEGCFYLDRREGPLGNDRLARLQELPNVLLTPHTAFYTDRVLHEAVEATLAKCIAFERARARG